MKPTITQELENEGYGEHGNTGIHSAISATIKKCLEEIDELRQYILNQSINHGLMKLSNKEFLDRIINKINKKITKHFGDGKE